MPGHLLNNVVKFQKISIISVRLIEYNNNFILLDIILSIINKKVKAKSILGILALIVTVALGTLQIFDWIRPKGKTDVVIKYHILNLDFPDEYGKSIYDFYFLAMDDSNFKNLLYEKIDSASVNKFLATDPFEFRFRSILKMKIANEGTTTAKNLKILFPNSNFIELENRGKQILEKYNENYIDILELRSDDEFEVTCWGDYHLDLFDNKISASYDGNCDGK